MGPARHRRALPGFHRPLERPASAHQHRPCHRCRRGARTDPGHARLPALPHFLDPLLPIGLLPPGWPRSRAREVCVAVYDGLLQPAQDHVRSVVTRFAQGPHPDIRAHTIAGMSAGVGHG
ncbi:PaaX family transcriptional regulator C-terminal domain-containing protein [Streptomyces sp. NPDC006386]|uniref:PaaX family transcriptional regulator C-terminal domain-containing protein n=1 Tax=Streptomyces sp. NPDC006386 TaxID=3156762 RepID=UPI0033B4FD5D